MPLHIGVTAAEQSVAQGVDCYCLVSGASLAQLPKLAGFISDYLIQSRFALLESLACHLAQTLMRTFEISGVGIRLTKHPYDMPDVEGAGVLFSMGDHPLSPEESVPAPWSHVFLKGLIAEHRSSQAFSIALAFSVDILHIAETDDLAQTVDYAALTQDLRRLIRALPTEKIKHIACELKNYLEKTLGERPIAICDIAAMRPK